MCNLYSNITAVEAMRQLFDVKRDNEYLGNAEPLPAIYPKGTAPIVGLNESGARWLKNTHWGFVLPQVSKKTGKPIQPKAVNSARDDKLRTSGFWRQSFQERRCLVPATSFCEMNGRNPATYVWFGMVGEEERPPFAFAGIWRSFEGNYGGEFRSLITSSIITTRPNELVAETHPDRMPVILHPEDYETWLTANPAHAFELVAPYPAHQMRIVQKGVGVKTDPGIV